MVLPIVCLFLLGACSGLQASTLVRMTNDASDIEQVITDARGTDDLLAAYYQFSAKTKVEWLSLASDKAIEGWVLRQWKRIISNAKLVHSDEDVKKYAKIGDYNRALEDFRSLRPTNVENQSFKLGVDFKHGNVGPLRVSLHHVRKDGPGSSNEQINLYLQGPAEYKLREIRYIDQKGPTDH